jgi:hypothetical protein
MMNRLESCYHAMSFITGENAEKAGRKYAAGLSGSAAA